MATFISHSPEETAALGEEWGRQARAGWIIGLSGDLGAGKTLLTSGIARGLGITARVQSPTFALVNEYSGGRLPMFHLDLYRLAGPQEIFGAGLEEYLTRPFGVSVVEWIERWRGNKPPSLAPGVLFRHVEIKTSGENDRQLDYEDFSG
ncbi:MAG TPA: tRNA (adenosine(37)-N6)-threonylcarbamoyltransferase complex ATPase subunit type 1 TsaE [Verrucomicrobiae bacterium]|jgi:tRNA threonylcarbamoyladenosine biosynthesis protein TsaE